jgi:N-acetyl-gamma-glutamyl-phosphate reductase
VPALTVGIAGASGYAGGELIRLVAGHPELHLGPLAAGGSAGRSLGAVHPSLASLGTHMLVETDPSVLGACDVVLLALPHGQSAALAAALPPECIVIDLGADHRLVDEVAWRSFYGEATPWAGTWTYGLPEMPGARTRIAAQRRIANPGCYPTSVAVALAPLASSGLIDMDDIVVVAASGTSGAGRKATESLLGSEVMGSMTAYKVGGGHQHTPEMEQTLGAVAGKPVTLSFTPTLAPMPRGILATCTARVAEGVTTQMVRDALITAYGPEPFITVLPEGEWPRTASTLGSNSAHVQAAVDTHSGRVIVVCAIDNLVKGAAGQAIQNLNIVLGIPEATGLPVIGVAP